VGFALEVPVGLLSASGVVCLVVFGVDCGVGGDVGVVAVATAGHPDVEVLTVDPGPDQDQAEVAGGALGGVDCEGPAVLAVLGEVVHGQHDPTATGEVLHDQAAVRSGTQHAEPVTVTNVTGPLPRQHGVLPVVLPACVAEGEVTVVAAGP
jgi:hypothetical protein